MLKRLEIQNYALIDQLQIEFSEGFTVITGETGAGKSILLGAIGLLAGERAEQYVLMNENRKCVVEGTFLISELRLETFFAENNLDFDEELIIRREVIPGGRSRAFINDTPVNLNLLKELGHFLLDIHSQYETLALASGHFQLKLLDSFAGITGEIQAYKNKYKEYCTREKEWQEKKKHINKMLSDLDYWQFQYNELLVAALKDNESELLEKELEWLENAESALARVQEAVAVISDNDDNISDRLASLVNLLGNIKGNEKIQVIIDQLRSALAELRDASDTLRSVSNVIDNSPEKLHVAKERIDMINHLLNKHRVNNSNELLELQNSFANKIETIEKDSTDVSEDERKLKLTKAGLISDAEKISGQRHNAKDKFSESIILLLNDLGMTSAQLYTELNKEAEISENGFDHIRILFNANKGGTPQEISKIASGGELSRLMLALKSMLADKNTLPTIIFDEIDAGISGNIAAKTALMLNMMGIKRQIIAISHLPQIAAKADNHIFVEKEETSNQTFSRFKILNQEERIQAIAVMLSDETISEAALETAKKLLKQT